jgi:hypothetical protein
MMLLLLVAVLFSTSHARPNTMMSRLQHHIIKPTQSTQMTQFATNNGLFSTEESTGNAGGDDSVAWWESTYFLPVVIVGGGLILIGVIFIIWRRCCKTNQQDDILQDADSFAEPQQPAIMVVVVDHAKPSAEEPAVQAQAIQFTEAKPPTVQKTQAEPPTVQKTQAEQSTVEAKSPIEPPTVPLVVAAKSMAAVSGTQWTEMMVLNEIEAIEASLKQQVQKPRTTAWQKVDGNALRFMNLRRDIWSQNGEDGILAHLLDRLNIRHGWVCEFGAADGRWLSNTWAIVETKKFWAVYIEADEGKAKGLMELGKQYANVIPICTKLSPNLSADPASLDSVLSRTPIPKDFEVLSIDIDSFDYWVWKHCEKYRPKIVIIEINSGISPYKTDFIHGAHKGTIVGTAYLPMVYLGLSKGYRLVCHTGNLIWIRSDLAHKLELCPANPLVSPECFVRLDWMAHPHKTNLTQLQRMIISQT